MIFFPIKLPNMNPNKFFNNVSPSRKLLRQRTITLIDPSNSKIYSNFYSLFPTLCPQKQRVKERSAFCTKLLFIEVTPLLFQMSLDYLSNLIIIKEKWQYAQRQLSFWRIVMFHSYKRGGSLISLLASIPRRGYLSP